LSHETITRFHKTETALIRSLERDPVLLERIKNLKTIPGIGVITALTWALEMDDVSRFRSVKQAISYCGLCGDERSSADKVLRTPISKQRNKHIQSVLVEAAKFAPQQSHELALVYEKEKQKGNSNRATVGGGAQVGGVFARCGSRAAALQTGRGLQQCGSVTAHRKRKGQKIHREQAARSCSYATGRRNS
jgi:transposase IS116/IS110/IS902 family protein